MKNLKESIGRNLVGAGKFEGRSKVVHKILLKYPTPNKLAASLNEMASKATDAKVKAKCLELSKACSQTDIQQYPKFVKKIAGLSKFWSIVGTTAGLAGLTAATTYLVKSMAQAADDNSFKNAKGVVDSTKALASKTGDIIKQDYDDVTKSIGNWRDKQIENAANWIHGKSTNAANQRAELQAADANLKSGLDSETAARVAGQTALSTQQNVDRAAAIKAWNDEQKARQMGDYTLTKRLNGKVGVEPTSAVGRAVNAVKDNVKGVGNTTTRDIKDAYGPYIEKAKKSRDAISNFLDKYGKFDLGNYSGT